MSYWKKRVMGVEVEEVKVKKRHRSSDIVLP